MNDSLDLFPLNKKYAGFYKRNNSKKILLIPGLVGHYFIKYQKVDSTHSICTRLRQRQISLILFSLELILRNVKSLEHFLYAISYRPE